MVTNAVNYVGPPLALLAAIDRTGTVEVAVQDGETSRLPRRAGPGSGDRLPALAESGRGLPIIEALSSEWGVEPLPKGKVGVEPHRRPRPPPPAVWLPARGAHPARPPPLGPAHHTMLAPGPQLNRGRPSTARQRYEGDFGTGHRPDGVVILDADLV